jgi:hypothetical protein
MRVNQSTPQPLIHAISRWSFAQETLASPIAKIASLADGKIPLALGSNTGLSFVTAWKLFRNTGFRIHHDKPPCPGTGGQSYKLLWTAYSWIKSPYTLPADQSTLLRVGHRREEL